MAAKTFLFILELLLLKATKTLPEGQKVSFEVEEGQKRFASCKR